MRPRLRPSTTPFCAQITSRDAPRGDSFASAAFPHHHHHHHRSSSSLKNISLVLISLSSRPTFSRTFEAKKQNLFWSDRTVQSTFETRLPPHIKSKSLFVKVYIPRANETSNGCALSFFLSFFPSFLRSFALRCDARFFFARRCSTRAFELCFALYGRGLSDLSPTPPALF